MDLTIIAVEYLHQVRPRGLLKPIDMTLAWRQGKCAVEKVFACRTDLYGQGENAVSFISVYRS